MIEIKITRDIGLFKNKLNKKVKKQLPFATALALTRTAEGLMKRQKKEMRRVFNKPLPYTVNAVAFQGADKRDPKPDARVFFREFAGKGTPAYKYLEPNIHGGPRRAKAHERRLRSLGILTANGFTAPGRDAPVNARGNIAGGHYTRLLAAVGALGGDSTTARSRRRNKGVRGYYVARKGGRAVGIRRHVGGQSKRILNFIGSPSYRPRYDFYGLSDRYVKKFLPRNFRSAFRMAMRTAR